jgi:arylsulfatase A-like enzyme
MLDRELPNIILIIMDSATAKRCSLYGHHRDTTPGMRRIAAEGVPYNYCFAPAAWTIPSHASLFSGLYPSEHLCDEKSFQLPEVFYSLPEILQQMGYYTVGISSNSLFTFQRGFEIYYELDTLFTSQRYHQTLNAVKFYKQFARGEWDKLKFLLNYIRQQKDYSFPLKNLMDRLYRRYCMDIIADSHRATEKSLALAQGLLKKYKDRQPLFIFFNLMETHWRYNPPRGYDNFIKLDRREKKELARLEATDLFIKEIPQDQIDKLILLYEQELAYVDDRIFSFYRYIEELGVKDRTMFIVTADHGECFGEHGTWGHFFGLYNELIRIPLVVKYPGALGLKGESDRLAQLHDLYATILEITDAPVPVPESSRSLLGPPRDFARAEHLDPSICLNACARRTVDFQPRDFMEPCRCLIDSELYKLIQWRDGRRELYDLKIDLEEKVNLVDHPDAGPRKEKLDDLLGPWGDG